MTVKISGEEVWLDTKKMRLRRRLPSTKRRLRPVGLKPRKKEKVPGEWASQLNGASICSYPPEDLVIEDYGRFLKKKGQEHSLRGARAHWSRSPLRCWMASISARPFATGTKGKSTSAISRRFTARWAR